MHTVDGHGLTVLGCSALRQLLITVDISQDYLRYLRGPEAEAVVWTRAKVTITADMSPLQTIHLQGLYGLQPQRLNYYLHSFCYCIELQHECKIFWSVLT